MDIVYLKLVSGESIISYVETIDEEYVQAYKPVQLHTINSMDGALIRTTKWIPFTDQNDFPIKVKNILLIATPTKEIEKYYIRSLEVLDSKEEEDYLLEEKEDWDEVFYDEDEDGWDEETVHAFNELAANNQIKVH
tara:strand:+ start:224 stop:631 length:408 start_codon:yes stop_codon:yes gene_type:complete